jgi:putative phage-type endonuclease
MHEERGNDMRRIHLEQGGEEWQTWRSKGIGASDAPIILGLNPWRTRDQLLASKVEEVKRRPRQRRKNAQPDNGAMERGRNLEPVARSLFTSLTGIDLVPLCVISDEYEWLKASLDGWNDPLGLLVELKAVNIDDHETALAGKVPEKYFPQVQHQLIATSPEGKSAQYVSYSINRRLKPKDRLVIVTVQSDPEFQAKLLEAEGLFWRLIQKHTAK